MTRDVTGSCFFAIVFALLGGLMAFFRPGAQLLGGGFVALGVIWAVDAGLAAHGTPEARRARLRLTLGVLVFVAGSALWFKMRQ